MIFLISSTRTDLGGPILIRYSPNGIQLDPYLGFVSMELGVAYLKYKNWRGDSFYLASIDDLKSEIDESKKIFLIQNEKQILEIDADPDGYEYDRNFF